MEIFGETIERELPDLAKQGVRTRFIGRRDRAPEALRERMAALEAETAANDRLSLWIAFDYGGRAELVEAARGLIEAGVAAADVDEDALAARLYAPELPDPDLLIRTSGELRLSNFLLWQLAYAELVFVETLWPDFGEAELRQRARRLREPAPAVRRQMNQFVSRVLVTVVGVPVVLVARLPRRLVAVRARAVRRARRAARALRDGARRCGRSCSPATSGALATLLGAQLGGAEWMVGGFMLTLLLAFLLYGIAETRQTATVTMGTTILGTAWIALGLGHLLLLRDFPSTAGSPSSPSCSPCSRTTPPPTSSAGCVGRHKLAPVALAGEDLGGVRRRHDRRRSRVAFFALYDDRTFLTIWQSIVLGARDRAGRRRRRPLRVGAQARPAGEGLGPAARRPRRHARPDRLAALRRRRRASTSSSRFA